MYHLFALYIPTGTRMNYKKSFERKSSILRFCRKNFFYEFVVFDTLNRRFEFYTLLNNKFICRCYGWIPEGMVI